MQPQEYVKQCIDGISQLSDTNMMNGINNTNAGLIQVVVVILILFFLVVIIRLMKSIDKFSEATNETNIILTRTVENINEIKVSQYRDSVKNNDSFSKVQTRLNEIKYDTEVMKSKICSKAGV